MGSDTSRGFRVTSGGLAGWLFADLALVLVVIFAAVSSERGGQTSSTTTSSSTTSTVVCSNGAPVIGCEPDDSTPPTTGFPATTTTVVCVVRDAEGSCLPAGVVPEPVQVFLPVSSGPAGQEQLWNKLEEMLQERSDLGANPKFGVVIVYGGAKGKSPYVGDRTAEMVVEHLTTWPRIFSFTYFEDGHDQGLEDGYVNLKLFPVLSPVANG